jgi:hypothetical protein
MLALLLASRLQAGEEAGPPVSALERFEDLRVRVGKAVTDGRLSAETGEAANGLAFELEKELLRRDAEIGVLRLEVVRHDGELQQRALDELIAAAAAREAWVLTQTRQLEELTGIPAAGGLGAADASAVDPPPESPEEGEPAAEGPRITFEPADLIENPDP